jgi:hypothetical protein
MADSLCVFSPSGVLAEPAALTRAVTRLRALGFSVAVDASARARSQRFAGDDEARLAAVHRVADAAPSLAMASRGGYGLTRLLDALDWKRLARSVERGTRWVGHSDFTALQLGLLAHTGAGSWAGPLAADDFGRADADGGLDEITPEVFCEAMSGELFGEQVFADGQSFGFRGDVESRLLPGLFCALDDEGRVRCVVLVGMHAEQARRMRLEMERKGRMRARGAEPHEFVAPPIERGLQAVGVFGANAGIDSVSRQDQIGVRKIAWVFGFRLERNAHAEARRTALQYLEQLLARHP